MNSKKWYINSPLTDIVFIILCPLIALIVTVLVCEPRGENYLYNTSTPAWYVFSMAVLTHAHVFLVFTRSHLNKEIFDRFKYRFTLIPIIVLLSMWLYKPLFFFLSIFAIYWDEWHSVMQTFGFGRIYDSKMGNDAITGRKLDMGLAFVVGLLPSLIIFTLLPHSQAEKGFSDFLELPLGIIKEYGWIITKAKIPMISFGILYIIYYIVSYQKLIKRGYVYSRAKLALMLVTGACSVYVSSRYTIVDGVFFGNIYHALQYIFIVSISEQSNLTKLSQNNENVKNNKIGLYFYFLIIIPFVFLLAIFRQKTGMYYYIAAFWLLTSLLHFWWDGFIWSVRKKDL